MLLEKHLQPRKCRRAMVLCAAAFLAFSAIPATAQTIEPSPSDQGPPHSCGNMIRLSGSTGLPQPTTLQFVITSDGDVKDITVAKSSSVPAFDKQFERCLAKWKFIPATVDGKPIDATRIMMFKWPTGERPDL
jgi:TonB family protein